MSRETIESKVFESYRYSKEYEGLKHKVVLYHGTMMFEYNNKTNRIRPIDSILWYSLELKEEYVIFLRWLNGEIKKAVDEFNREDYVEHPTSIGCYSDGYIIINVDELKEFIKDIDDEAIDLSKIREILKDLLKFTMFLEFIYNYNLDSVKGIINTQIELL